MRAIFKFVFPLLAMALVMPSVISVQAAAGDRSSQGLKAMNFCDKLNSGTAEKITQALADREKERVAKAAEIKQKLKTDRANEDSKLKTQRDAVEKKLDADIAEIAKTASSTPEKQALAEFRATIKAAMAVRKAAVDKANKDFRAAIDKLHADRQASTASTTASYRNTVKSLVASAKADCAAGSDANSVRQALLQKLKAAQDQYRANLQTIDKMGQQVKVLVQTRNDAVKAANQAFKAVLQQALTKLKGMVSDGGGAATSTPTSGQ